MKTLLIPVLALLTGCATGTTRTSPFDEQATFAAQREAETVVVADMEREVACAHVVEVLMDLDCVINEVNSNLGLVSAKTQYRLLRAEGFFSAPQGWRACGGSNVTVAVKERDGRDLAVRATFEPTSPEANQAFKTLLRRSVAEQPEK